MGALAETEQDMVPIDDVVIGDRARTDPGDLTDLVTSMEKVGLLNPILLNTSGDLIHGFRRLSAARLMGWAEIPARVATDFDDARLAVLAERDENVCRLAMTPSEAVKLGRKLEELEKPAAERRMAATLKQNATTPARENFPSGEAPDAERTGKVDDLVGKAVGMSGKTYRHAKQVVDAAEAGDPDAIQAKEEMDRTGKVSPAHNKIKRPAAAKPSASTPKRKSLTPALDTAGWNLRRAADRVQKLVSDDRFPSHSAEVAPQLRSHITYTADLCASLLARIEETNR
jgi:ParB family transcriptional regulator, chromosome partitioning protein